VFELQSQDLDQVPQEALQELCFGDVRIRAQLPRGWRVVNYVTNHHYIELEDDQGNVHRLLATALIRGVCASCGLSVYVETRMGAMACPHCVTGTVTWLWGDAKLAFTPELNSRFVSSSATPKGSIEDEDTKP
jgi:hypothetical protein